jgi:hypothetical protein
METHTLRYVHPPKGIMDVGSQRAVGLSSFAPPEDATYVMRRGQRPVLPCAVDLEFAGYGSLAAASAVPLPSCLLQTRHRCDLGWCSVAGTWRRLAHRASGEVLVDGALICPDQGHESSKEPARARAGQALTRTPIGPWPMRCASICADRREDSSTEAPARRGWYAQVARWRRGSASCRPWSRRPG